MTVPAEVVMRHHEVVLFRRRDRTDRLSALSRRLTDVRRQRDEAAAQAAALAEEAEDLRIRALVSEGMEAAKEHKEAARHAERAARAVDRLSEECRRLEAEIDALLDQPV